MQERGSLAESRCLDAYTRDRSFLFLSLSLSSSLPPSHPFSPAAPPLNDVFHLISKNATGAKREEERETVSASARIGKVISRCAALRFSRLAFEKRELRYCSPGLTTADRRAMDLSTFVRYSPPRFSRSQQYSRAYNPRFSRLLLSFSGG